MAGGEAAMVQMVQSTRELPSQSTTQGDFSKFYGVNKQCPLALQACIWRGPRSPSRRRHWSRLTWRRAGSDRTSFPWEDLHAMTIVGPNPAFFAHFSAPQRRECQIAAIGGNQENNKWQRGGEREAVELGRAAGQQVPGRRINE
jgi:hypothetical protein